VPLKPQRVLNEHVMTLDLWAEDGTTLRLPVKIGANADPEGTKDFIVFALKDEGWVARGISPTGFVVSGTTKSRIVRVSVRSTANVPTVRWIPLARK
jgi:hypothetical protein